MIENEIDSLVQDMEMRMRYSGLSLQNYLEMSNTSLEEFRAQYRDNAYNRVKTRLVLEAVTKAEDITVTDEDREKEYQKLAKQYQRDVEEIKKTFAANSEYMDDSVLVQKTIDFLLESAVMVEPEEDKTDASAAEHDHGHEHREPDQAEAEKQQTEGVEEQSNNE
jgi:trigger factor